MAGPMDDGALNRPEDPSSEERDDLLRLASLAAHQLRSPLNAVQTLLSTVIGGFVGPVDPRQRQLLEKAVASCSSGIHLVADLMKLRTLEEVSSDRLLPVNLATALDSVVERVAEAARQKQIEITEEVELAEPGAEGWMRGDPGTVEEIAYVLLDNAVKYTPPGGRVVIRLFASEPEGDQLPKGEVTAVPEESCDVSWLNLEVTDTGIGIPPEAGEKIFSEFYRAPNAKEMAREGTGLGLAFAHRAAKILGGELLIEPAPGGGTRALLLFPRCPECAAEHAARLARGEEAAPWQPPRAAERRPVSQRVVVVGGVAAGSKVAAKLLRLDPDAEVTVVEKGRALSYAGCGLPYYISGLVADQRSLVSTPLGEERDSSLFHDLRHVRTYDLTEATQIDRKQKTVRIRSLVDGKIETLVYDKLVLATGASPRLPPIPGVDLAGVYTLHGVESAEAIKNELETAAAKDVVIVGAGLLGSEITESIAVTGARVSLVEQQQTVLGIVDPELALLAEQYLAASGVKIFTSCSVTRLEGEGRVEAVHLDSGKVLSCDFVILAAGVRPNVELAIDAGLELGTTGAIKTDQHQKTSDPSIFAIGDCAEQQHLVTGAPTWIPMGSTALKQARVAAINLCEGSDTFEGVVGSTVVKIFDQTVARTGMGERQAREAGFDPVTALVPSLDCAHYIPTAKPILLKLIADRKTRRVLGAQGLGEGRLAKRIDIVATALSAGMTVDQLAKLDLCFAPPYALAIDSLLAAANIIRNKLEGLVEGIPAAQLRERREGEAPPFLLDVRLPSGFESMRMAGSVNIPLGSLRGRLHELPSGVEIVVLSRTGLKSYEAALILHDRGFEAVWMLDGGLESWPYELERF